MHQRGPAGAAGAAEAGRARDRGRGDARWVGLPQGPAGAAPAVRPAPPRKLHLSRLLSCRPLSKRGFERRGSPGLCAGARSSTFGEAGQAHACVPASAALACVPCEMKSKETVWPRGSPIT
ncbi:Homeobox Protein Aristaless-Like 3 [Manis pentadactyla]|nr:Homeobox Protein Aristaless-Like 3 [Manis pentadactyla]